MMLASFRNVHQSQSIVVCGCGHSLVTLRQPNSFITIGVNDVGRLFHPDYLVVIDGREHLHDRFRYVETSQAGWIFTQRTNLGLPHPRIVNFRLDTGDVTESGDAETLPFSRERLMTPHVAVCLALHMGARNIGLIGVDLTDHHFFASTGAHEWAPHLAIIDREFARLGAAALERGCRIFNLSETSRLSAFPKMPVTTFASLDRHAPGSIAERQLRIVSYATTPLVGVPTALARCINARTQHHARCIWAADRYHTGVSFTSDVNWRVSPMRAEEELEAADVIVLHNGKVDQRHRALIESKPVVTMAHNYITNVDDSFVRRGFPGVVVGQYQATLPEFRGWSVVPSPVPIWEYKQECVAKNAEITIVYTPSDKHQVYPREHPLYWHSKGYDVTMRVLDGLAARYSIRLVVTRNGFMSHAEILRLKQRAHIVIDECVTGSYHRNSLEGLAAGCVVVNGVGLLPGVQEALRHCGEDPDADLFVRADLSTLESRVADLIDLGPDLLGMLGASNREWMERHWEFGRQWDRFWRKVVDDALMLARAPLSLGTNSVTVSDERTPPPSLTLTPATSYKSHVETLVDICRNPFFVTVGAADGKSYDPLYATVRRRRMAGLLIEPHPEVFQQLKANFESCADLAFENVAVCDQADVRTLFYVSLEAVRSGLVPDWALGVSTFYTDRNALGGQRVAQAHFDALQPHIRTIQVPCATLMTILNRHDVTHVDLIQVDTEGHDYHVLRQIDFTALKPKLVLFEAYNLPPDELRAAHALLAGHSYHLINYGKDTLAVHDGWWRKISGLAGLETEVR